MARHLMFSGKSPISGVLDSPRFFGPGAALARGRQDAADQQQREGHDRDELLGPQVP